MLHFIQECDLQRFHLKRPPMSFKLVIDFGPILHTTFDFLLTLRCHYVAILHGFQDIPFLQRKWHPVRRKSLLAIPRGRKVAKNKICSNKLNIGVYVSSQVVYQGQFVQVTRQSWRADFVPVHNPQCVIADFYR